MGEEVGFEEVVAITLRQMYEEERRGEFLCLRCNLGCLRLSENQNAHDALGGRLTFMRIARVYED